MTDKYDRLFDILYQFYNIEDSYSYNLTRIKGSKLTVEDFEKFTEQDIDELVCCIKEWDSKDHAFWRPTNIFDDYGNRLFQCSNCQKLESVLSGYCRECGAEMDMDE